MMALVLLALSIFLVFYSYVLYPWFLKSKVIHIKPSEIQWENHQDISGVSIIIAARNEAAIIGEKLNSIFACGFPAEKIEVLVGSDASDDATDEIVQELSQKWNGIKLYHYPNRQGKPAILNVLIPVSKYDLVVLTDANVIFAEGLLFKILRHFKNEKNGLVGANVLNTGLRADGISEQESLYINRETIIKHREGLLWGTMMGPFGACYAIRRDDFSPFPAGILVDDFYLCMKVLENGNNALVDLRAICYEDVPNNSIVEFKRKVRIGRGNFQNLRFFAPLLLSDRPGLALSFFSHKVLRWFSPLFILIALISNILLLEKSFAFVILFALQLLALSTPAIDFLLKKAGFHFHLLRLASHFYQMNAALFIGMLKSLVPSKQSSWDPTARNLDNS